MLFDTHTHINFKLFSENIDEVIKRASKEGVRGILACGTDLNSSQKAVKLAEEFKGVYAAVGIHPHHVFEHLGSQENVQFFLNDFEKLLTSDKVVAVGEVGTDRHTYQRTKYKDYQIDENFLVVQRQFLSEQIDLARRYNKSLILHNRHSAQDLLAIVSDRWTEHFEYRTVFHFCESDERLLAFALAHHIFIGVDGDVTFDRRKQEFIEQVPLELLVLETDSPFVVPEPYKTSGVTINEPSFIGQIAMKVAEIKKVDYEKLCDITYQNSKRLFNLS